VSESNDSPAPCDNHWDVVRCLGGGRVGRVRQPVLPLLPADATPIGPVAGLVDGAGGGAVFVFGQATFAFATDDEVGRRLAAVQLVATDIASAVAVAVAAGFGIGLATLWRWKAAYDAGGVVDHDHRGSVVPGQVTRKDVRRGILSVVSSRPGLAERCRVSRPIPQSRHRCVRSTSPSSGPAGRPRSTCFYPRPGAPSQRAAGRAQRRRRRRPVPRCVSPCGPSSSRRRPLRGLVGGEQAQP
jgi:hypothetical protein